jgi:hypothetical protein
MYKMPLYGKEWSWRNVKMEAREQNNSLPVWDGKGFVVQNKSLFYY